MPLPRLLPPVLPRLGLLRAVPAIRPPLRAMSLRTVLAAAFLLLPLLAAGTASFVVAEQAAADLRAEAQQATASSAAQLREQLEREMAQRWREVQGLAESLSLLGPGADAPSRRQRLERLRRSYPHYAWLGLASPDGTVLAATGGMLEGQRVAERPWFRAGLREPGMQDVHPALLLERLLPPSDEEGGRRFVDVSVPVLDAGGALLGVLGAHVSWAFAREIERSVLRAAAPRRPELEVLAADAKVLLRPEGAAASTSSTTLLPRTTDGTAPVALQPPEGRWLEARSPPSPARADGDDGAGAAARLGWTVLARLDEDAALAPVRALRGTILACGAAAGLVFAALGWLLAHRIARPLRTLQAAAEEACRGERNSLPAAGGYAEAQALSGALGALMVRRNEAESGLRSLANDLVRQVCERATESVRTADELRRSAAYLDALFQNAPFGLLMLSALPDGRFRYDGANPAALRLTGFAAEQLQGREPHDVLPATQADAVVRQLRQCVSSGTAHAYDSTRDSPNGRRDHHVVVVPVHDADGAVGRLLVCVQDVTERSRLEAELREAHGVDAVGRLAAGVAHDFNNLLQALMGNLELLGTHVAGDPWADAYVAAALQSAERGARLTHQMLSFSRKQFLRARPLQAKDVLDGVARLVAPALGNAVSVRTELPPDLPSLQADPSQLEAALLNLALNARDAMPDGGRILLTAAMSEAGYAADAGSPGAPTRRQDGPVDREGVAPNLAPGRYVVLAMADDGTGMEAETAAHAFEPFFTTKGVGKGSGLGLSMVQGFARQSGGEALIRSTPGQGTVVELWLPAVDQGETPASMRASMPPSMPAPMPVPMVAPVPGAAPHPFPARETEATEAAAPAAKMRGAAWLCR